jgi:hypothetical protein
MHLLSVALLALAASPQESLHRLEAARADVTKAMARVHGDAPTVQDLDAAHNALTSLKDAIDQGAPQEPNDLDYARAALGARKELRADKDIVEERRSKLHIFDLRRELDKELAALGDKVDKLKGKSPGQGDFDAARAAAGKARKALADAKGFGAEDAGFAKYLSDSDAAVSAREKAIDDRWMALSADKQRGLLEDSEKGMLSTIGMLNRNSTDAQFDAADKAINLLTQRLTEGKPLEAKDEGYRAAASRARGESAQASKRLGDLLSESGLARLQAEIEPARKDLLAAQKGLHGKASGPDQVAEARTAAIVVGKLLEKYQSQASHSPKLTAYVADVRKDLTSVQAALQEQVLEQAEGDLKKAMAALEKKSAGEQEFKNVDAATAGLEKAVEAAPRDPALFKTVADSKALLRDMKAREARRHVELDVQLQRAKVEAAKKSASDAIAETWKADATEAQVQAAAKAVEAFKAAVDEGAPLSKKDHDYGVYSTEITKKVVDYMQRVELRKVSLAARDSRAAVNDSLNTLKAKQDAAQALTATEQDLNALEEALKALAQLLDTKAPLERLDKGYAAAADRARGQFMRAQEQLERLRDVVALRQATGGALTAGDSALKMAETKPELAVQREQLEKALALFQACADRGARTMANAPAMSKTVVVANGQNSTTKEVVATCGERGKSTELKLHEVKGLIRMNDGVKKSYETAEGFLSKGKKADALAQFRECYVEGVIVQGQYPELKDRALPVAGGQQQTLGGMVQECFKQKKALDPN